MAKVKDDYVFKLKGGEASVLECVNPFLERREPIVVFFENGQTNIKIGDGKNNYNSLPFISDTNIDISDVQGLTEILSQYEIDLQNLNDKIDKIVIEDVYDPTSDNAQSGKAVAQAISDYSKGLKDEIEEIGTQIKEAIDAKPGQKTPEGGEIFNDYETNKAAAENAAVFGSGNTVEGKNGFVAGTSNTIKSNCTSDAIFGNSNIIGNGNCNLVVGQSNINRQGLGNIIGGTSNITDKIGTNNNNANIVSGDNNVIYGGGNNIVSGNYNRITETNSNNDVKDNIVSGKYNKVEAKRTIVTGNVNKVTNKAYDSLVVGNYNELNGTSASILAGSYNILNNHSNIVAGKFNEVNSARSLVIGEGNIIPTLGNAIIGGGYSKIYDNYDLFVLGNGSCSRTTDKEYNSNKTYYIQKDGKYVEFTGDAFEPNVAYYEQKRQNAFRVRKTGDAFLSRSLVIGLHPFFPNPDGMISLVAGNYANVKDDTLFALGNGWSGNNLRNAFEVKKNGAVALGNYPKIQEDSLFVVGGGWSEDTRRNAFEVKTNGEIYLYNDYPMSSVFAQIAEKLLAVYTYKGSVANYEALPKENIAVGDVYNVEDTGINYAWTGEAWDSLGGTVDLSNYADKTYVDSSISDNNNSFENYLDEKYITKSEAPSMISQYVSESMSYHAEELKNALTLTDNTTGKDYKIYINNGKLQLEEVTN